MRARSDSPAEDGREEFAGKDTAERVSRAMPAREETLRRSGSGQYIEVYIGTGSQAHLPQARGSFL